MSADRRRTRALQACVMCKTRKKRCDKALPSCSYCIQKDLDCVYRATGTQSASGQFPLPITPVSHDESQTPSSVDVLATSTRPPREFAAATAKLYRPIFGPSEINNAVHDLIRSTSQYVDQVTSHYFENFHRHLPIISRSRFQSDLIATSSSSNNADSAVLLLSICLMTAGSASSKQQQQRAADEHASGDAFDLTSLYLSTKALLAQVQGCHPASLRLVQATLLLAVYEYAHGRPEAAFVTLAGCARMAYAAGIHDQQRRVASHDRELLLGVEEAHNTWWAIVIYERAILPETTALDQPPIAPLPTTPDARLPIEAPLLDRSARGPVPRILVSCPTSPDLGGFGRTAQATCLLDQVLRALAPTTTTTPDTDSRLLQLQSLDTALQTFLAQILPLCKGRTGIHCGPVALAVRALFLLHEHILSIPRGTAVLAHFRHLSDWKRSSTVALDTAAKMVLDIAESHIGMAMPDLVDAGPPAHVYMVVATRRYMRGRVVWGEGEGEERSPPWGGGAEEVVGLYLAMFEERWGAAYA